MGARIAIGIDVGGSAVKAAAVEIGSGRVITPRHKVATPQPSTPASVVDVIAELVGRIEKEGLEGRDRAAPVGIGVPCVVMGGVTKTAANVDRGWIGFDAGRAIGEAVGRPVTVLNDADAAGIAEMRFGAGVGVGGTVFVLTLGTGLGSALFIDGRLVPNTELGHMEIRGADAEDRSAAVARVRDHLSWADWAADLDEHLRAIDRLFWPDLIILGGGVSRDADRFLKYLTVRPRVVPAELRNDAGIVGAALAAVEAIASSTD